jgi:hypothetical protein
MGFGGGSSDAGEEANRAERERQAAIHATQGRINSVFDSPQRAGDIADFVGAMRTFYNNKLAKDAAETQRNNTFALARSGLIGGSAQVDKQKEFADKHSEGVLEVERRAQGAGAQLESADQDARARLLSLATTGLDATTGAEQAAAAMRTNLQAGRSQAEADNLGNVFGGLKEFQDRAREAAERRRANQEAGFSVYGNGFGFGGRP